MPTITINGHKTDFTQGQTILQVANVLQARGDGVEIPQYCYHDGLSIVASCRICLVEVWVPNQKSGQLEPFMGGKLVPSCQQPAMDGMVVYSNSPKAVANQKAVMEYLLINHPLDCPVCDQSGECFLQDYSYQYGRGVSRFEEAKVKQPKKDVGPHVLLYSDRCIMCTRCVRFTREVTGTSELFVQGRGNKEEIDVFPGMALDNELASNVIDLCPVGALLDKDFLFAQRVWFLKETAGIDPLTASGDNIWIHHNQGEIYRVKPRTNLDINKHWITDEVRYGWKFVHAPNRLRTPTRKQYNVPVECDYARAYDDAVEGLHKAVEQGKRLGLIVSPMLTCEEAYLLAALARAIDPQAILAVGPIPVQGEDKTFPKDNPNGFRVCAEKAPNARGVRRVLEAFAPGHVQSFEDMLKTLGVGTGKSGIGAVIMTGNYPTDWVSAEIESALSGKFSVLIDTHKTALCAKADIVLPGATFAEKAGTYENHRNVMQAFDQAIPVIELAKTEGQLALDMMSVLEGAPANERRAKPVLVQSSMGQVAAGVQVALPRAKMFDAAQVRQEMASKLDALSDLLTRVKLPPAAAAEKPDMQVVEL